MIHLVYPYGEGITAAPWSIGNHLAKELRLHGHIVAQYDWTDASTIRPTTNWDILIGHPHPDPGHVFTNSLSSSWRQTVAITPWGGLPLTEHMLDQLSPAVDSFVLICGPYWAKRVPKRWNVKTTIVDMAIDPLDYPMLKHEFNPAGKRKMLYIGCTARPKGTEYLETIVGVMTNPKLTHIGHGLVTGATEAGFLDLTSTAARELVAQHDFLVHTGRNDANPTTVLEAMCWGLIPACTPQSGWIAPDVVEIFSGAAGIAASQLDLLINSTPTTELVRLRDRNLKRVREKYNWNRFAQRIMGVLV